LKIIQRAAITGNIFKVNIKTESKRLLVASQELNKKPVENYMGPGGRLAALALAA
jgi:hypothetical protein